MAGVCCVPVGVADVCVSPCLATVAYTRRRPTDPTRAVASSACFRNSPPF